MTISEYPLSLLPNLKSTKRNLLLKRIIFVSRDNWFLWTDNLYHKLTTILHKNSVTGYYSVSWQTRFVTSLRSPPTFDTDDEVEGRKLQHHKTNDKIDTTHTWWAWKVSSCGVDLWSVLDSAQLGEGCHGCPSTRRETGKALETKKMEISKESRR